jgi:hypothetical protein
MNENTFNVGDKVKIIDLNTIAEVASISEDGTQFTVKYNDAGGQEQTEVVTADKLASVEASEEAASEPENPAENEASQEPEGEEEGE